MGRVEYFGVGDFVVFGGNLLLSILIGVYFALKDRKKSNVAEYHYGGKRISPVAIGISIAVTYISAVTVLAFPTESYLYGLVYIWYSFATIGGTFFTCLYYIPLFLRLQLTTLYQYLEMRFHPALRKVVSACAILLYLIYMSFAVYIPALSLNAVTPINLHMSILLSTGICTIYTTMGGLKAVIWTDVIQFSIMFVGAVAALVKATIDVGGIETTWNALERSGRLNLFQADLSPTIRNTIWTTLIGGSIYESFNVCVNQSVCQRFLSCKSVKDARIASIIAMIPKMILGSVATLSGCVAYAYFEGCDPMESGLLSKKDQMFPYLVLKVFRFFPGMAGLFVAVSFSGTMSTVSSGLNALSVQILEDFVIPLRPRLSDKTKLVFSKAMAFVLGVVVTVMAYVTSFLDATVMSVLTPLKGALSGAILGVYTLGIFFPWCNTKGAIAGQLVGTAVSMWIAIGGIFYPKSPEMDRLLPVSTHLCNFTNNQFTVGNSTTPASTTVEYSTAGFDNIDTGSNSIYAVSIWYTCGIGCVVTVVIGMIFSFLTGRNNPANADPRLFCPIIDNRWLPKSVTTFFRFGVPLLDNKKITLNTYSLGRDGRFNINKDDDLTASCHEKHDGSEISGEQKNA